MHPVHALVPVKNGPDMKSRLGDHGSAWAEVFLADVLDALLGAERVDAISVVTSDSAARAISRERALEVIDDQGADLNTALTRAAEQVGPASDILVVLGDLPCLSSAAIDALVSSAPAARWFTSDGAGTGSTMLFSPAGEPLAPAFGPRSRAAHRLSGAREHPLPSTSSWAGLHRDVDTPVDLWDASRLGVGPHTAARIAAVGLPI